MASVSGPTKAAKVNKATKDTLSSALAHANRATGTQTPEVSTGLAVPRDHEAIRSRRGAADTKSLLALIFRFRNDEEVQRPTPRLRRAVERYNKMVLGAESHQTGQVGESGGPVKADDPGNGPDDGRR